MKRAGAVFYQEMHTAHTEIVNMDTTYIVHIHNYFPVANDYKMIEFRIDEAAL